MLGKLGLLLLGLGLVVGGSPGGTVHAQVGASPVVGTSNPTGPLLAQSTGSEAALQAAIDSRDLNAIIRIVNSTPRDKRQSLATMLLDAARSSCNNQCDKSFASSLASVAFVSGGLTPGQQNAAIIVVRSAPAGIFIVQRLLSNDLTGGYGFGPLTDFSNLIVTETPLLGATNSRSQSNGSPN